MKSAVVILTLLGCDCDGVACEYIRTVTSDWTSVESCEASSDFRGTTAETSSYPLVIARCSVDSGDAASPEVAAGEDTGAAADGQIAAGDATAERGASGWTRLDGSLRGLVADGAASSIRTIRSSLTIHAGEPIRSMSSRVLAGLWN